MYVFYGATQRPTPRLRNSHTGTAAGCDTVNAEYKSLPLLTAQYRKKWHTAATQNAATFELTVCKGGLCTVGNVEMKQKPNEHPCGCTTCANSKHKFKAKYNTSFHTIFWYLVCRIFFFYTYKNLHHVFVSILYIK